MHTTKPAAVGKPLMNRLMNCACATGLTNLCLAHSSVVFEAQHRQQEQQQLCMQPLPGLHS